MGTLNNEEAHETYKYKTAKKHWNTHYASDITRKWKIARVGPEMFTPNFVHKNHVSKIS